MTASERFADALHVSIDLWYPDCWEIEVTERLDVGLLGYGIYTTGEEVATLFTVYADEQETISRGVEAIAESEHVHSVSEMASVFRQTGLSKPGNATRELLVVHDGNKQISQPLTSRGFVCTGPIDIRDGREYWELATNHGRETVQEKFADVREEMDAEINVRSMTQASRQNAVTTLPVDRLTKRQLEVFQLARERGYYEYPKGASAGELADELCVTTSTLHEHLHKVESILLGQLRLR
ncbi:bacterio-opsin activator [Salinigranum rubrum]|uniref:Bacterio-opsin activator n=1 Tax=Salinigranum rubrum TaxID=755307 RepID=A0A2I8VN41_9EURY|nr:helix-turn-helix domain-containing protein [Salinigranum rubrum]AUV83305.1 bacterio-opsin activator [Salinigranum rubrum]